MIDPAGDERDVLDTRAAGGMLVRGSFLRLGSYAGVVALSVVSAAVLTRYLGVVRFSQYTTVISLVTVVAVVTDAGMAAIGTREYAVRDGSERDAFMRDLLGLRVTLTLVGVALAAAFAVAAGYSVPLLIGTVMAGLGTVALVFGHTLSIPLLATLRFGAISALDLARQALMVAAILALVLAGAGLLPVLTVGLAVNLLLIPPTAALVRGSISTRPALRPRAWASLLRLTVAFALATAVGTIYVYTAQILTSLVANGYQSGLFAVSFRVFVVAASVPGLLVSGALPLLSRAARDDRSRLAYALQRIFEASLIVGVGAALLTVAGAPFIIAVVGGPKYAAAADVLRIQALAMLASFVLAGWAFALISLHLHRGLVLANAAAFAVSCALTLTLAPAAGAKGAAVATVCGEATLAAGYLWALTRRRPQYRPHTGITAKVALAVVPAAALALVPPMPSLARVVVATAVYGLLILVTGAIPDEIIELIPWRGHPRPPRSGRD